MRLQQRQARETGICPVRRELYSQCFGMWPVHMSPLSGPAHSAGQILWSVHMSSPTEIETITWMIGHYWNVS